MPLIDTSAILWRSSSLVRSSLLQLIKEDVGCVRLRDPAARSELETLLTYPGVHALIWHRIAHRLWGAGWRFPARLLSWLGRFLSNVDIHPAAKIGHRFFIDHGACVVIGETAEVGNDVTLYHGVTLGGTSWSPGKRHPSLEDRVVVGAGAKILGPITVGRGTRVGANSVVIESTPPDVTVVGIPARVVRPELEPPSRGRPHRSRPPFDAGSGRRGDLHSTGPGRVSRGTARARAEALARWQRIDARRHGRTQSRRSRRRAGLKETRDEWCTCWRA